MKDYIPKKPKEFKLEKTLYLRMLHTVRDYPRMVEKINDILYGSPCGFEEYTDRNGKTKRAVMPHGTNISNPTEKKAMAIEKYQNEINAIDKALNMIPVEYRQYIFDNIVYKASYPVDYASKNTWSMWRMRFLFFVAENLKLL